MRTDLLQQNPVGLRHAKLIEMDRRDIVMSEDVSHEL